MSYNKKFNPNIWETPRVLNPNPPFGNNQPNFYQNQGNFNFQQNQNYSTNFQQNQQLNIRPMLSQSGHHLSDQQQPPFRKFKNNNNNPDYRRPGPACARNNYGNNNNSFKWNQDKNRRDNFNNRDNRQNDTFDGPNNNSNNNNCGNRLMSNDAPNISYPNSSTQYAQNTQSNGNEPQRRSLVDELKAAQSTKKNEVDANATKNALDASRRLLTQLKTMDKDGVKDLINNPKQPHKKKVLNFQAREKLREQMRQKLKQLGNESDSADFAIEPDECIDYSNIPDTFINQIGRTIDPNYYPEDMDLSESNNEDSFVDKDIEVVKNNLGTDFLMGSEMLLMNGFSLLAEAEHEDEIPPLKMPQMPPLPVEAPAKPPTPPPEPNPIPPPPPVEASPCESAIFTSVEKPWAVQPAARPTFNNNFADKEWDEPLNRNPDPPAVKTHQVPEKEKAREVATIEKETLPEKSVKALPEKSPENLNIDSEWDNAVAIGKPTETPQNEKALSAEPTEKSGRRANETYGEYRKRLTAEQDPLGLKETDESTIIASATSEPVKQIRQPVDRFGRPIKNNKNNKNNQNRNDKWTSNWRNQNNSNNDSKQQQQQNRKSRYDMDRGRDKSFDNFQQRNNSRDTNASHDSGRYDRADDNKDGHNYRFQKDKNSQEPTADRLNSILNPKPLQFQTSFNKRNQNNNNFNNRSISRNRTTPNDSAERDFDENLMPSPNDVKPCLSILKKVMELDAEMSRVHEKIHGVDKVIANLQSERVGYQKNFSKLMHDRKVLFDNLWKRSIADGDKTDSHEGISSKLSSNSSSTPIVSNKSAVEKKLQNIVDQKKRKNDEPAHEEPKKAKTAVDAMETTSAAEKAALVQKEREFKSRKQEKKRLKALRREREEAEKLRVEERNRIEAIATTNIKVEPQDKPVEKPKSSKHSHHQHQPVKSHKQKELKKNLFAMSDTIKIENFTLNNVSIRLPTVSLDPNLMETFSSEGFVEIKEEDWKKWLEPINVGSVKVKKEKEIEILPEAKSPEAATSQVPVVEQNPLEIVEEIFDPLAIDEIIEGPPTPGSSFTENEDSMLIEVNTEQDYSEWAGNFSSHDEPIILLRNINGKFMVCATEGGKVLKYHLQDGKLAAVFSKHTSICNFFVYDKKSSIYTVSSDGFLHKIKFNTFQLVGSENFGEPLQVIEHSKSGIFIGTKSGQIFKLKTDLTEREEEPICCLDSMILSMKATREGSRNILLVSSRTNSLQVRDANNGLLLRTLSDVLVDVSIYDMVIEGSTIYCGSNRQEIFTVDFTTGALKKSRPCGAGTICVKLYKNYLIAACYDGNIYIFDIKNDDEEAVNICGPSNMLLSMDLWGDKIIATTKDKTLKIMNIPIQS